MQQDQIEVQFKQLVELIAQKDFTQKYNIQTATALSGVDSKNNTVHLYKLKQKNNEDVILKLTCKSLNSKQDIQNQQKILCMLNQSSRSCLNVIRLSDKYRIQTQNKVYLMIIIQECSSNFLKAISTNYCQSEAFGYVQQIIEAMYYLHSNKVLHMDLKPDNILLKDNKIIKIIDFGESLCEQFPRQNTHRITKKYCPPQILKMFQIEDFQNIKYDTSYDIWSFGIVLYQTVLLLKRTSFLQQMKKQIPSLSQIRSFKLLTIPQHIEIGQYLIQKFRNQIDIQQHSKKQLYQNILKHTLVEYSKRQSFSFQNIKVMIKQFKNKSILYVQFLIKRIELMKENIFQQMLNKNFLFFKKFNKLQKLILQLCYYSIIYQQYIAIKQYYQKQRLDFKDQLNPKDNSHEQYMEQLLNKSNKQLQQIMTLLAPSLKKFKTLSINLKSKFIINSQTQMGKTINHIQSSLNLQQLFSFKQAADVMKYLLDDLITMTLNQQDQKVFFYLVRVCNLEKSFPKKQFQNIQQKIQKHNLILNQSEILKEQIQQLMSN